VLSVVLLRVIGHVLDKVDGGKSTAYRSAIDSWWGRLKSTRPLPAIFWSLIDEERNSILKEYQTTAGQGVTVPGAVIEINVRTGEQRADPPGPPTYHYTFNAGHYVGQDQREVLLEAIAWWEQQLASIDEAANSL